MLFVSLPRLDLLSSVPSDVDGVELRLDLMRSIDFDAIRLALQGPHPIMLTLRGASSAHETLLEELLALAPPFFDLDCSMRPAFLERMLGSHPATKFVLSSHDAAHPMRYPAYTYKIATTTHSTLDALRQLVFAKRHSNEPVAKVLASEKSMILSQFASRHRRPCPTPEHNSQPSRARGWDGKMAQKGDFSGGRTFATGSNVSVICMGARASFARVLGPVVGNRIDYACLDDANATAPGQISVRELLDVYRYRSLTPATAIYGLIGDPVDHSIGHIYHNRAFQQRGKNAVYVKMPLSLAELEEFWPLAQELGIRALSVTRPLKEAIVSNAAINTIQLHPFGAHNTDGVAALDAIERRESVQDKRVVLLGAGGTARAIAMEATRRGAKLWILNRTAAKAKQLASELGAAHGTLADLPDYDILIQCTPAPLVVERIPAHALVMDVVYAPRETPLLQAAINAGARVIYGEELFERQAARQQALWSCA